MQDLPEWLWVFLGGGVLSTIVARIWQSRKNGQAAHGVAQVVTQQAEQQEAQTKRHADESHDAATAKAQAAAAEVAGADRQALADLINEAFEGDDG